ncbi:hypothetical protein V5799_003132, partial [Amblyomma americanum]
GLHASSALLKAPAEKPTTTFRQQCTIASHVLTELLLQPTVPPTSFLGRYHLDAIAWTTYHR